MIDEIDRELFEKLLYAIKILTEVEKMLNDAAKTWTKKKMEKITDGRN